ncbi:MAG: YegP family protein [Victivallales bacterium]|nr:YegP family protein [Victivallales bacterium]
MGKFEIKETKNGGFLFNLLATNGQVVATSQTYKSRKTLLNGIASVKKNAAIAQIEDQTAGQVVKQKNPKFEVYNDKSGKPRFRLTASNGQTLVQSQGYANIKTALAGVASVQKNAPDAEIVDAK